MASKKIQLYTDRANTIEASPETSANCVILSDGNDLQKVLDNDLTNPTAVHEETSFKVGVGDIDVSSSVVDGEVGRMVIKGKTYQNILPEPSTHVLTNNKEMFKVNEGLDPNVEIVDGVSKSAILSGQTKLMDELGNECDHPNRPNAVRGAYINASTGEETLSDTSCRTTYIKAPHETFKIRGKNRWKKLAFYDVSKQLIKTLDPALNSYDDYVVNGTLIPSNAEYMRVSGSLSPINSSDVLEPVLEILDANNSSLYNTQLRSCKLPVLSTVGKNLIPLKEDWVQGQIMNGGGISVNSYSLRTKSKIKVKPNTKYTFSTKSSDCKIAYHEWEANGKYIKDSGWITAFPYTFTTNNKAEYINLTTRRASNINSTVDNLDDTLIWQLEESSSATSYEPHKTNILHTPEEVVLRSLPNGVCDTLNLMTGEYVKRIGEIVLDGTQNWTLKTGNWEFENTFGFITTISDMINTTQSHPAHSNGNSLVCSHFPSYGGNSLSNNALPNDIEMVGIDLNRVLGLRITKTKLSTPNAEGLKAWLQVNPVTVQYELQTPIAKTVDLSSSGNWEKVVLNGSERWMPHSDNGSHVEFKFSNGINNVHSSRTGFSNKFPVSSGGLYERIAIANGTTYITVESTKAKTVEQLQLWLSQNPITVWYQTTSHQDSTQVKQPIFFKNGHVVQSSGADNSLIPTLDYQAKTSNSYVMDLMKANTRYTMKAKSASGTFTIDGTSYGAGTNGTFTTPSSMTNKLLVMSNKSNEEVMILEGGLTSKDIPYFKGIKSAFEDESKIEVLSQNKNIFTREKYSQSFQNDCKLVSDNGETTTVTFGTNNGRVVYTIPMDDLDTTKDITFSIDVKVDCVDETLGFYVREVGFGATYASIRITKTDEWHRVSVTVNKNKIVKDIMVLLYKTGVSDTYLPTLSFKNLQIEYSSTSTPYESYKMNSTKIPLLSPLRSLPNGVCDEVIINRMKKKATLIQRVGVDIYNGSETWGCYNESSSKTVEGYHHTVQNLGGGANNTNLLSNSFRANYRSIHNRDEEGVGSQQDATYSNVRICISRTRLFPLGYTVGQNQVAYFQKWLQSNPVTVLYPLLTPVVTEIDLESFPLVYKDGHIFLNSEIAPVVEIDYNINQSQQIQANNETLQRHELDILDLDNLIVSFVNAEYNLRLLKFDMELSMMALAE